MFHQVFADCAQSVVKGIVVDVLFAAVSRGVQPACLLIKDNLFPVFQGMLVLDRLNLSHKKSLLHEKAIKDKILSFSRNSGDSYEYRGFIISCGRGDLHTPFY